MSRVLNRYIRDVATGRRPRPLAVWSAASRYYSSSSALLELNLRPVPMPSLSPTMTHGTISAWKKAPGDQLRPGDILCEIETDKASVGFEVQDDGVLAHILVSAHGPELKCGEAIAYTVDDVESYAAFVAAGSVIPTTPVTAAPVTVPQATTPAAALAASTAVPTASPVPLSKQRLSPAARHIVDSQRLDTSRVHGTAKGGIISKSDIVLAIQAGLAVSSKVAVPAVSQTVSPVAAAPTPAATSTVQIASPVRQPPLSLGDPVNSRFTDIPNSNMRKVIARRLAESKATVPHFYTSMEVEIDELLKLRKTLKKDLDVNVSVNDLVIKSAALALRDWPQVNSKWSTKTNSVEPSAAVDVSVAVATPSGLITPIVFGADKRGLTDISDIVKVLAGKAKEGKLKPEEYQGGSFSISNLGMFGITSFTAVINPPQACILAVGAGVGRVLPPSPGQTKPRVATILTVQLSGDRRVVDEALAGNFLQSFRQYLSRPSSLLL